MARELPRIEQQNLISISGRVSPRTRVVAPVPEIGDPAATSRAIGQLGSVVGKVADSYVKRAVIKEYNAGYRSLLDAKSQASEAASVAGDDPEVFRTQMNEWFSANSDKYSPSTWSRLDKTHADLSYQGVNSFARISEAKDDASTMAAFKGAVAELEAAKLDAVRNNQPEVAADLQRDIEGYYLTAAATDTIDVAVADDAIRLSREGNAVELGKNQVEQIFDSSGADAAQLLIDSGEGEFVDPDVRLKAQSLLDTRKTEKRQADANARLDLSLKQNETAALIGRQIRDGEVTMAQLVEVISTEDEDGNPVVSTSGGNKLLDKHNKEVARKRTITDRIIREQAVKDKVIAKALTAEEKRLSDVAFVEYKDAFNNPLTPTPTAKEMLFARRGQSASVQAAMGKEWFDRFGIAAEAQLEFESYDAAIVTGVYSKSIEKERSRRNTAIIDSDLPVNEKLTALTQEVGKLGVMSKELPKFGQSLINRITSAVEPDETMTGTLAIFMSMRQDSPATFNQLPVSIRDEVDYHQSQTQGSQVGAAEAIEERRVFLKRPLEAKRILDTRAANTDGHVEYLEDNFDAFDDTLEGGQVRASISAAFSADFARRIRNGEGGDSAKANALVLAESRWQVGINNDQLMQHSPKAYMAKWLPSVSEDFPSDNFDREYADEADAAEGRGNPLPPRDSVRVTATSGTRLQFDEGTPPEYIAVLTEPWNGHEVGSAVLIDGNTPFIWRMKYEDSQESIKDEYDDFRVKQVAAQLLEDRLRRRELERSVIEGRPGFAEEEAAERAAVESRRATAETIKERRVLRRRDPREAEVRRKERLAGIESRSAE